MDTQTRHALKQDKFVQATSSSLGWVQTHRNDVIRLALALVVALAIVIAGTAFYVHRSAQAQVAFGQAVQTYIAPLRPPGAPADSSPGSFASSTDRAKAANSQFLAVADRYGSLAAGKNARYFAGLTYIDMGQTAAAESSLKQVAGVHDANLSSLAKAALAGVYHQTGRDDQAVSLYQELIAKPSDAVPASSAKLQLAELYEATRPAEARRLYAEIEDKEKATPAGQIAAQRLKGATRQ
ncbi:MAG TPA: coatomer subunit epsilon [Acidisarcina sp.]